MALKVVLKKKLHPVLSQVDPKTEMKKFSVTGSVIANYIGFKRRLMLVHHLSLFASTLAQNKELNHENIKSKSYSTTVAAWNNQAARKEVTKILERSP